LNSNNELDNSNANVRTLKYIKKIITDKKSRAEPYLLVKDEIIDSAEGVPIGNYLS
jgi:hypothetical protein